VTLAEFLAGVVDHLDRLSIAYMVGGSTASSVDECVPVSRSRSAGAAGSGWCEVCGTHEIVLSAGGLDGVLTNG